MKLNSMLKGKCNRIPEELVKSSPKATYGEAMIRQALEQGAVAKLLISEGMRKNVVEIKCKSCGNEWSTSIGRMDALPSCPNCKADGDDLTEVSSVSLIDEFSNLALKVAQKSSSSPRILKKVHS